MIADWLAPVLVALLVSGSAARTSWASRYRPTARRGQDARTMGLLADRGGLTSD